MASGDKRASVYPPVKRSKDDYLSDLSSPMFSDFCCSIFAVSLKCLYQLVENLGWFFQSILFIIKRLASKVAKPERSSGLKDFFVYDTGKHNFTFFSVVYFHFFPLRFGRVCNLGLYIHNSGF